MKIPASNAVLRALVSQRIVSAKMPIFSLSLDVMFNKWDLLRTGADYVLARVCQPKKKKT